MQWWSWVLTAIGITGLWAAGSHKSWGWVVGIGAQFLWLAYAITTHQYGFIVAALAYGTVYTRNYLRWRSQHEGKRRHDPVQVVPEVPRRSRLRP